MAYKIKTNLLSVIFYFFIFLAIPITIGFRKTLFNVSEDAGSVAVCYAVLSGRTAGRSISVQMRTLQGDATGRVS